MLQRDMSRAAVLCWACNCASFADSRSTRTLAPRKLAPTGSVPQHYPRFLPARSSVQHPGSGRAHLSRPRIFWKTLRISETMTEPLAFFRAQGRERQRAGTLTFRALGLGDLLFVRLRKQFCPEKHMLDKDLLYPEQVKVGQGSTVTGQTSGRDVQFSLVRLVVFPRPDLGGRAWNRGDRHRIPGVPLSPSRDLFERLSSTHQCDSDGAPDLSSGLSYQT